MARKIMIISPHPDDAELAMGMQIQDYISKGDEIYEIILCRGELGGDPKVREKEARKAAKLLRISKIYFYNYPNTKFDFVRQDIKDLIEKLVNQIQPEIIYAPWPEDEHIDHIITGRETLVAARSIKTIIYYECYRSRKFNPNYSFYQGQRYMDKKIKAISCHNSQIKKGVNLIELARVQGIYWANKFYHHASINKIRKSLKIRPDEKIYAEVFYIERGSNFI